MLRDLLICWALVLAATPTVHADERRAPGGWVTAIDLITIGPGDHLYARFGHSALMVTRHKPGTTVSETAVYNYGDADFHAPGFSWRFFRGTVTFRVSAMGSLSEVMNRYASSNRTVAVQRLRLTAAQALRVKAALERAIRPENRDYRYHHLTAGCASKARDLLDDVLDGAIRAQLGAQTDPQTVRHYARLGYAGHIGAEIANDLWMGRLHDQPQTKYFALYLPRLLGEYLQQVKVPDPAGSGRLVPLASGPELLYTRRGAPATAGEGRTLVHLSYLWIVLVLALGLVALLRLPDRPKMAGVWLLLWALPMGLASACMVFGALVSTVTEGRVNELLLAYPTTDLALIGVAIRWLRGEAVAGRTLRGYAVARLALVALALLGHATGVLFQQPRALVWMALVCTALLVLATRRARRS